ncbi:MAG: GNAT family N-acetyltransferase [Chloroflexi bacterium]|nr:GNAT family N-acetyltransferase [Chloroflexota bacterium]
MQDGVWPGFMLQDPVADRSWHHLGDDFASFQLALLDPEDRIVAGANASPLAWDGTDDDLPIGWDDQFERSVAGLLAGTPPDTLGAIQIVVSPGQRGAGLSARMLDGMRRTAQDHGYRAVIACVRPTLKSAYPLTALERYVGWTRTDGLPFDPWIRVHVRAGGRIARPSPRSMVITGTIAEWERWASMAFPESGRYVVPGALVPVEVDRSADVGTYHDPNV